MLPRTPEALIEPSYYSLYYKNFHNGTSENRNLYLQELYLLQQQREQRKQSNKIRKQKKMKKVKKVKKVNFQKKMKKVNFQKTMKKVNFQKKMRSSSCIFRSISTNIQSTSSGLVYYY